MTSTSIFDTSGQLGAIDFLSTDTVARFQLGTVRDFMDNNTGQRGEAMYVQFLAATTVGQVVVLDAVAKATKASSTTHANTGMSAGFTLPTSAAADDYGWVGISGKLKAKAGTVAAAGKVMLTATAGTIDDAAIAGSQLVGAVFSTADGTPAAGFAYVTCNRPAVQTQIT